MTTNPNPPPPPPSHPDPDPLSVPDSAPATYLSLLPIEVHEHPFKHAIHMPFKKGLPLSALVPHVEKILIKTKEAALQLSNQISGEKGELHYISSAKSLRTMTLWLDYLTNVYKETLQLTELSPQEIEMLRPLYQLQEEIRGLLDALLPTVLEKRKEATGDLGATLKQAIMTMQKKTERVAYKVGVTYQLVSPRRYARAQQLIIHFFADFLAIADRMSEFVKKHIHEWSALCLREGRDLLVKDPANLPCSFLFSIDGNCYLLIESVEHLLGKGSEKEVFRAISLPKGHIKAIIKPSAAKELVSSQKQKSRHKSQLFNMWTESELLIKLHKRLGVIQIDDRMVFEIEEKKQLFLMEDYYWDGSLHDYFTYTIKIPREEGRLSIQKRHDIMRQTLEGLRAIHEAKILHHDIKPDNILIDDSEEEIKAAIADFQLAAYEHDKKRLDYLRCRAAWVSPEYARLKLSDDTQKHYSTVSTEALDVWSLGVVFYILATHSYPSWQKIKRSSDKPTTTTPESPPQDEKKEKEEIASQTDQEEQEIFEAVAALQPNWLPEEIKQNLHFPLLEKMLDLNPASRCSAETALKILEGIQLPLIG